MDGRESGSQCGETRHGSASGRRETKKEWVIVTDSEYVVKGMTELFPEWRVSVQFLSPFLSYTRAHSFCVTCATYTTEK